MHLALVISSLNAGGAERVISKLANYWVNRGHCVTIITIQKPDAKPFYKLEPSVNLIQIGETEKKPTFFRRGLNIFTHLYRLRKVMIQLDPDILVSFIDLMNIATLFASIGLKKPVIISERIDPNYHHIPKFFKVLRRGIYPQCTWLVVQTRSAASYFRSSIQSKAKIVPNAVPYPECLKVDWNPVVHNIVSTGRLAVQKDHVTLIYAFNNLLESYPELTLTVYGEGPERKNLEKLVKKLGLQEKVRLPGTTDRIYETLAKADLFIFSSRYEGFPNALAEAMAVGLPVIASDCSGNVDLVRDRMDGRLFPVGNVDALTQITLEIIEDHAQRKKLATNAKEVSIRFHEDKIYALWDSLVNTAVKKKS